MNKDGTTRIDEEGWVDMGVDDIEKAKRNREMVARNENVEGYRLVENADKRALRLWMEQKHAGKVLR